VADTKGEIERYVCGLLRMPPATKKVQEALVIQGLDNSRTIKWMKTIIREFLNI